MRRASLPIALLPFLLACSQTPAGPGGGGGTGGEAGSGGAGGDAGGGGSGGTACGPDTDIPEQMFANSTDPEQGDYTIDEALADLPPGPGPLRAIIETSLGTLTCELFPEQAPYGVANFVGLARGRRPWKDSGDWVTSRFYDGLTFHRVIDDFMAQGGDPLGTGSGGPGYQFPGEKVTVTHEPGTLAYANAAPMGAANWTNGSQFYITEVTTDWLDGHYTIFGHCDPIEVIQDLTAVPTNASDQPIDPLYIIKVTITRCAP